MTSDQGSMFKPSFRIPFPEIADQIVLRLPRALISLVAFSGSRLLFLSLGWPRCVPPGAFLPSSIPETHHSGVPIPLRAGPGGLLLSFSLHVV